MLLMCKRRGEGVRVLPEELYGDSSILCLMKPSMLLSSIAKLVPLKGNRKHVQIREAVEASKLNLASLYPCC